MPGATNDGGEDSTRGVVSGESGFAHTGSVVNNQCGDFIFHGWTVKGEKRKDNVKNVKSGVLLPTRPVVTLSSHFLLTRQLQLKRLAVRWRSRPTFRPNQTKGSCAAFCYCHIRTWFGFEQLCGYRRHGARPAQQGKKKRKKKKDTIRRRRRDHSLRFTTFNFLSCLLLLLFNLISFNTPSETVTLISLRHNHPPPLHSLHISHLTHDYRPLRKSV